MVHFNCLAARRSRPGLGYGLRVLICAAWVITLSAYGGTLDILSTSVTAGSGDHTIRPNGCYNLNIVIANNSGTPMTGISAVLSFYTVLGVEVTQPYSTYADIPANSQSTNSTPFQISTLPTFFCDDPVNLMLSVSTTSHGAFVIGLSLKPVGYPTGPDRFDASIATNIPEPQVFESTNVVAGFAVQITNVAVSLWLNAAIDSNMVISLIAPDGAVALLTEGNGAGADFGTACSPDAGRTTFNDYASASITTGTAPFVGSFRPQVALSNLLASPVNGNWRLRIANSGLSETAVTLNCWTLLLYPFRCSPGSGACGHCLPPINGSITANDPVELNRISRNASICVCTAPKTFPGTISGEYHYNAYTFTNASPADACVTVCVSAACDVHTIMYLGAFDPMNITNNYLGDAEYSTGTFPGLFPFSCTVPAGATFTVVVNEVEADSGCENYTLTISGLPCPQPALSTDALPNSSAHLSWPSSAGGYILESSPSVQGSTWTVVTNEPLIDSGSYNVTNDTIGTAKFYRLHKP